MNELLSVVILHYKQPDLYKTAVDSVLEQDYPCLELIFADDCSKNLDENDVRKYIEEKKGTNIKNVIYQFNEENVGTIKNINKALKNSTGRYIIFFAADDRLCTNNVLSELMSNKAWEDNSTYFITGQSVMMDWNLDKQLSYFVPEHIVEKCNTLSPHEIHRELLFQDLFAMGATVFRKECFEKYGEFDENLKVIEDWSYFLDFSKKCESMNGRFEFQNINVLMHRAGGISENGKNINLSKVYIDDMNIIYETRVFPYIKEEKNKVRRGKILLHYLDIASCRRKKLKYMILNFGICINIIKRKVFGGKNNNG